MHREIPIKRETHFERKKEAGSPNAGKEGGRKEPLMQGPYFAANLRLDFYNNLQRLLLRELPIFHSSPKSRWRGERRQRGKGPVMTVLERPPPPPPPPFANYLRDFSAEDSEEGPGAVYRAIVGKTAPRAALFNFKSYRNILNASEKQFM